MASGVILWWTFCGFGVFCFVVLAEMQSDAGQSFTSPALRTNTCGGLAISGLAKSLISIFVYSLKSNYS